MPVNFFSIANFKSIVLDSSPSLRLFFLFSELVYYFFKTSMYFSLFFIFSSRALTFSGLEFFLAKSAIFFCYRSLDSRF